VAIDFREAGSPADEESLNSTEQKIGLALPGGYRGFLAERNGGFLETSGFFDENVVVEELFSAGPTPVRNLDQTEVMYERYAGPGSDQGLPPFLIPAGADPLGNLICVSADDADGGMRTSGTTNSLIRRTVASTLTFGRSWSGCKARRTSSTAPELLPTRSPRGGGRRRFPMATRV
jgi:hypothetical protein